MRGTGIARTLLLILGGPAIWFLHLNGLYAAQTLACADGAPVAFATIGASLTLVSFIGLGLLAKRLRLRFAADIDDPVFWGAALSALAVLGIVWTNLAAALAPSGCG